MAKTKRAHYPQHYKAELAAIIESLFMAAADRDLDIEAWASKAGLCVQTISFPLFQTVVAMEIAVGVEVTLEESIFQESARSLECRRSLVSQPRRLWR